MVAAAAMTDRLFHHAEATALEGDSYRPEDRDLSRETRQQQQRMTHRRGSSFRRRQRIPSPPSLTLPSLTLAAPTVAVRQAGPARRPRQGAYDGPRAPTDPQPDGRADGPVTSASCRHPQPDGVGPQPIEAGGQDALEG